MEKNKNTNAENGGGEEMFVRFPSSYLKQHYVLVATFTILLITGMPMLAPKFFLFRWTFTNEWVFTARSVIHRIAAVVFIAQGIYHIFFLTFNRQARKDLMLMLPRPKDAGDALGTVLWNLGIRKAHPKFGRFSFIEKFEYLALIWGSFIMILTGAILWFNQILLQYLPKIIFDLSTIVHGFEAMLAGLSIIIWHMYMAHLHPDFFPMNRTWLDGKISKKHLKKHHYLEYLEIMRDRGEPDEEDGDAAEGAVSAKAENKD